MAIYTCNRQSFHHVPEGIPVFERVPGALTTASSLDGYSAVRETRRHEELGRPGTRADRLAPGQSTPQGATRRNIASEMPESFQAKLRVQVPPFAFSLIGASA